MCDWSNETAAGKSDRNRRERVTADHEMRHNSKRQTVSIAVLHHLQSVGGAPFASERDLCCSSFFAARATTDQRTMRGRLRFLAAAAAALSAAAASVAPMWQAPAPVDLGATSGISLEVLQGGKRAADCSVQVLLTYRSDAAITSAPSVSATLSTGTGGHDWSIDLRNGWSVALSLGVLPAGSLALSVGGNSQPAVTLALPDPTNCIGRTAGPAFSLEGGAFAGAVSLDIGPAEAGSTVHYSLSGAGAASEATATSGTSLTIGACGTTTVTAFSTKPGLAASLTHEAVFDVSPIGHVTGTEAGSLHPTCISASALPQHTAVSADGTVSAPMTVGTGLSLALQPTRSTACGVVLRMTLADYAADALLARSFIAIATPPEAAQAAAEVAAQVAAEEAAAAAAEGRVRRELLDSPAATAAMLNLLFARASLIVPVTLANLHATDINLGNLPLGSQVVVVASPDAATLIRSSASLHDAQAAAAAVDPFSYTMPVGSFYVPDSCEASLPQPVFSVIEAGARALQEEAAAVPGAAGKVVTVTSSVPGSFVYVTADGSDPRNSATALFSSAAAAIGSPASVTLTLAAPGSHHIRAYAAAEGLGDSAETSATVTVAGSGICANMADGLVCAPSCGLQYYRCSRGVASQLLTAPSGFLCVAGQLRGADETAGAAGACANNLCTGMTAPRPGNPAAVCVLPATGSVAATWWVPCGCEVTPSPYASPSSTPCFFLSASTTRTPASSRTSSISASASAPATASGSASPSKPASASASRSAAPSVSATRSRIANTPSPSPCPYLYMNPPCSVTGDGWSCVRSEMGLEEFAQDVLNGYPGELQLSMLMRPTNDQQLTCDPTNALSLAV